VCDAKLAGLDATQYRFAAHAIPLTREGIQACREVGKRLGLDLSILATLSFDILCR
jgi:hypothetical protein